MTDTTSYRELDQRIEQLVRDHIAAVHRAAREALERAFVSSRGPIDAGGNAARVRELTRTERPSPKGGKRRAPAEVSAMGERIYQAVCTHPGESMAALAKELGAPARELQRPMALLRQAGRVRSVGQRDQTRYFPRTSASS